MVTLPPITDVMTFAELIPDVSTLRAGNEQDFVRLDDAALAATVNADQARAELKIDLQDALSLRPSDTDSLDDVASVHSDRLQVAMAYKALALYFANLDEGEGSRANAKAKTFSTRYAQARALFPRLQREQVSSHNFTRIRR